MIQPRNLEPQTSQPRNLEPRNLAISTYKAVQKNVIRRYMKNFEPHNLATSQPRTSQPRNLEPRTS